MALVAFGLIALQSSPTQAQWTTNGNNINNTNTGNVGIGTTSPGNPLQVTNGSGTSAGVRVDAVTATTGNGGALVLNTPSGSNHLIFETSGVQRWVQYVSGNDLRFWATSAGDRLTIQSTGNVGIGTTSPSERLHVAGGGLSVIRNEMSLWLANNSVGGETDWAQNAYYNSGWKYRLADEASRIQLLDGKTIFSSAASSSADAALTWTDNVSILQNGNVGIGTTSPTAKLHVAGDGRLTGNLTVDGNINAKYQDVAEWVESSQTLPAGTVVVLDQTKSNQVIASSRAYDTRVAGIISTNPGIVLGENGAGKVLVATTGRVRVKVDASAGAIQVGDLLVTSDKEGLAMKSRPLSIGGVQPFIAPAH